MRSELRETLQIPPDASPAETARICNEYYAVYSGICNTCSDPMVRSLAQERIRLLKAAAAQEGVSLSAAPACAAAPAAVPAPGEMEAWLSGCGEKLSRSQYEEKLREAERLPESAEKHYLLGCLRLNSVNYGANSAKDVTACFERALALDGDNLAYRAALQGMKDAWKAYSDKVNELSEDAKDAQDKVIHTREAEAMREKVYAILKKVGTGIGGAFAAIAVGIAAVFAFVCECAGDC